MKKAFGKPRAFGITSSLRKKPTTCHTSKERSAYVSSNISRKASPRLNSKRTMVTPNMPMESPEEIIGVNNARNRMNDETMNGGLCRVHDQICMLYCETCDEPVCDQCQYSDFHADDTHRIIDLREAFEARLQYVCGFADQLVKKKDVILAQIDKVEYRLSEVNSAGGIIENDIKTEYTGMLDRLKFHNGGKIALLQHDVANLEKDIEKIDNALNSIDEYTQSESQFDYIEFLSKYHELVEYIEYALAKPYKSNIDVSTEDLSNEYKDHTESLKNSEKIEALIELKDGLICNLLEKKEIPTAFDKWAQLKNVYEQRIGPYQMICAYCGIQMNITSVNGKCIENTKEKNNGERFTIESPPTEMDGTKLHFFGRPLKKSENFVSRILVDMMSSIGFNAICVGSKVLAMKVVKEIRELDADNVGKIPLDYFLSVLIKKYDVENECFGRLATSIDPESEITKMVCYREFADYIERIAMSMPEKNRCKLKLEDIDEPSFVIDAIRPVRKFIDIDEELNRILSRRKGPSATPNFFKDPDSDMDICRSIVGTLGKRGLTEQLIYKQMEKYDTTGQGTISLDKFYSVFNQLGIGISGLDVQELVKRWYPDALASGNVKYGRFLCRLY